MAVSVSLSEKVRVYPVSLLVLTMTSRSSLMKEPVEMGVTFRSRLVMSTLFLAILMLRTALTSSLMSVFLSVASARPR